MPKTYPADYHKKIRDLHDQGKKPKEIAEMLQDEFDKLKPSGWPDHITNVMVSNSLSAHKQLKSSTGNNNDTNSSVDNDITIGQNVSTDSSAKTTTTKQDVRILTNTGDFSILSNDQIKDYIGTNNIKPSEEQEQFTRKSDGSVVFVRTVMYELPPITDVTHTAITGDHTDSATTDLA